MLIINQLDVKKYMYLISSQPFTVLQTLMQVQLTAVFRVTRKNHLSPLQCNQCIPHLLVYDCRFVGMQAEYVIAITSL